MPVDDAITLVTRSFDKYMLEKQERMSKEATSPEDSVAKKAPDFLRPTANTLYLLNLLADNRYLTVDELDTVLDYLQLRRDRLVKSLGGGGGSAVAARPVGPTTPPPIKKGTLVVAKRIALVFEVVSRSFKTCCMCIHTSSYCNVIWIFVEY